MPRRLLLLVLFPCFTLTTGCAASLIGDTVGAVSGITSGTVTANPAVGYAVGITMQAATDATIKYILREWTNEQQQLMANIAGELALDQIQSWEVKRVIPYGNERGQLQVVREIDTALVQCREVLFTVENDKEPSKMYLAPICKQHDQWKWAAAEPAVTRWQGLQ